MTWFKIDDGFWSHPKTMALSAEAVALWVRAGAYSCQHLTDGHILSRVTPLLDPSEDREEHAAELVAAGLWDEDPEGYRFHDWDEYQESSEAVKKRRDQWKQRQQRARSKGDVTPHVTRDSRRDSRMESRSESLSPVPSRPTHSSSKSEAPKRVEQLPDNWEPTDKHADIARERGIDLAVEAEKFRDWCGATGRTYKNHDLAFNGWLRRATPERGGHQRPNRDVSSARGLIQAHEDLFGSTQ